MQTETVLEIAVDVDLDKEVPCDSAYHASCGHGPATLRVVLVCPECGRPSRKGSSNVCTACYDWFSNQMVSCMPRYGGCGFQTYGSHFFKEVRPI